MQGINPLDVSQLPDWESGFDSKLTIESRMPYKVYTGILEQSAKDKRDYRLVRLPNNMVVICISDVNAKTAAVSLSVGAGSFANPSDTLGLAHLLEHMLFLGSAKYPEDGGLDAFITNNSGWCNAYTSGASTNYIFDFDNGVLDEALDRISSCFIEPLLRADAIGRETNVVDSEYQSKLTNDYRRQFVLQASLSNPNHPYSRFRTGNCSTLDSSDPESLRKKVVEFYNRYYSADIIKLVVSGNYSLDELTEMAVARFSAVESKGNTSPILSGHPLSENELGKIIRFKTLSDISKIRMAFALPDIRPHMRTQPFKYITWLIDHEGSGSLTQYLRKEGLATDVYAVLDYESVNFAILNITFNATAKGLAHYEQIVSALFAYLHMVAKCGPQKRIHDEIANALKLKYEYYEQTLARNYVLDLSAKAQNIYQAPEHMISCSSLMGDFDPSLISAALELCNSTNYRLLIGAKSHDGVEFSKKEKFYDVPYHVADLPEELTTGLGEDKQLEDNFHLPEANVFFPEDFSIMRQIDARPELDKSVPTLLKYNDSLELWYRQDDKFYLPKGTAMIKIVSPIVNSSPLNRAIFEILSRCWRYIMAEKLYSAKCAGLSYSISDLRSGIAVSINGFSDKLPLLAEQVVKILRHSIIDKSVFNDCMKNAQEQYSQIRLQASYLQAPEWINQLLVVQKWHSIDLEKSLSSITLGMLNSFSHDLFEQAHVKMLVTGNFTEEQALSIASTVQTIVKSQPLPTCQVPQARVVQLDTGYYLLPKTALSPEATQSLAVAYIQLGQKSDTQAKMVAHVLDNLFNMSFYNQLRTLEQLGYSVSARMWGLDKGNLFAKLLVQSESNPIYLSLRITEFLRAYRQTLVDLHASKVTKSAETLVSKRKEKLKTIAGEANRMWNHIKSEDYDYEQIDKEIACLQKITKNDLVQLWDTYINPATAPRYTRIDLHIWPTSARQPSSADLEKYPASILALQRLVKDGLDSELSLEELSAFVTSASKSDDPDNAFDQLMELCGRPQQPSQDELPKDGNNTVDAKIQKIRTGLQMALEGVTNTPSYHKHTSVDFATIGMTQTCEGIWVINDSAKFQSTQELNALLIPATELVPKYDS
ncbi:metalloprotease [Coemansia guatemalensis]|uniref:Metalloprotease n=1 Tax=Coemansia guatemalensis TaxID=2761395 RepID=A0A9W8I0J8_9FUNG|nr:metalloprotease [Coemansia guatemalensis]